MNNELTTEQKFVKFEPLTFDELLKLYTEYKVTYSHDGIGLYIDIILNNKPKGVDDYYAKILKNSIYDRQASFEVKRIKDYINSLIEIVKDELYECNDSFIVIKHIPSGRFMRLDGNYSSYEGLDFNEQFWYEVTPKEVITIEYTK